MGSVSMAWMAAASLILPLDAASDEHQAAERLLWLGRYALSDQLQAEATRLRSSPHWSASLALGLSLAWLLAGDGLAADRAFLEADRLAPAAALVPDPWGLWTAEGPEGSEGAALLGGMAPELVGSFHRWRWLEPLALQAHWQQQASQDWSWALTPEGLDGLALLVRHREALDQPLQPFLAQLVPEALIEAEPAQALVFWGFLSDLWPDWSFARLKAAELALARGDHGQAGFWLQQAPEPDQQNPWLWDLQARQALAVDQVALALDHWGEAVRRASASGDGEAEELAELFRQRRREARRGPGLLQARSLLNRGQATEARALLEQLLEQDPQWQPLRSLLDQALQTQQGVSGSLDPATAAASQLDRFTALIERSALRHGLPLPDPHPASEPLEPEAALLQLEAFSRSLAEAEARFALAA